MLKPATSTKQSQSFWKLYGGQQQQHHHKQHQQQPSPGLGPGMPTASPPQQLRSMLSATVVGASTAQQLLPGVQLPDIAMTQQPAVGVPTQQRRQKAPKPPAGWSPEQSAALLIGGGITLQVGSTLLWVHMAQSCDCHQPVQSQMLTVACTLAVGHCQRQIA